MAKTDRLPNRKYYVPSGRINWPGFLPLVFLTLVGSFVGAWLMAFLFRHGFYFVGIVPAIFGLAIGGLTLLAVKQGQCRSRVAGAVLGIIAGLLLHLGYYYFDLRNAFAPFPITVTALPTYIRLRLETDVLRDTHAPDEKEDASRRSHPERLYINGFVFLLEMGIVIGIAGTAGFRRAKKPFCEQCGSWMDREITRLDPLKGEALFQSLKDFPTPSLAMLFNTPEFSSVPNSSLALDICPSLKAGRSIGCAAFVSIKQIQQNPKGAALDAFESSKGRLLVTLVQTHPEELPLMSARFPFLSGNRSTTGQPANISPTILSPNGSSPAHFVETKMLPPEFSGRILSRRNILIGNALTLSIVLGIFIGLGLAVLGGITAFPDHPPAGGIGAGWKALGIILMVLGIPLALASIFLGLSNNSLFSGRWLREVARRELKRRPASLVNPDSSGIRFVEVVPKLNWGKMMLETATDVGFLIIDQQRGLVLFEGDKECYRISVESIISCAIEIFVQGEGTHGATNLYYVVIRAHHPTQFWEAPFRIRAETGVFGRRKQRRATEQFFKEINELKTAFAQAQT